MAAYIPCLMKEFWLEPINVDTTSQQQAIELAKKINQDIYSQSHRTTTYGFAQAVCIASGQDLFKWQVRVIQAIFNQSTFTSIEQKKFYKIYTQNQIDLRPKGDFQKLIKAIQKVIHEIDQHPHDVLKPTEVQRRLNKLVIYLLLAPQWPYPSVKNNSIENVVQVVENYEKLFTTKDLTTQNQENFNVFITKLSKHVRLQSLTIKDLSSKILTRAQKSYPSGMVKFDRIKEFNKRAIERILWPSPSPESDVKTFCLTFARHAYVYKPDADSDQNRAVLQETIQRLVTLLIAYDRAQSTSTLFNFMMELMKSIKSIYESSAKVNNAAIAPLVWTLEALVENPDCIKYMRPAGPEKKQQEQNIFEIVSPLFSREMTWRVIGTYVVWLGNAELFTRVLDTRINIIKQICFLSENWINLVFQILNDRLQNEVDPIFYQEYVQMYIWFLKTLASINKLHFLKAYAGHQDFQLLLRSNLVSKLGFTFMQDLTLPLEAFFSNATFQALNNKTIPENLNLQRTLVRLFTKFGENPVANSLTFDRLLFKAVGDFTNEFEILCEEILSQIGRSTPAGIRKTPQRELIPAEEWIKEKVLLFYKTLKVYVFKCIPLTWKTTTFNGAENLRKRLCLHAGKLYYIEYDQGEKTPNLPQRKASPPEYNQGEIVLKDVFTHAPLKLDEAASPANSNSNKKLVPDSVLYTDLYPDVKQKLKTELQVQANRDAISFLTEAYMSFTEQEEVKQTIEKLLTIIFDKMKEDSSIKLRQRLQILASFLQVMAPFFKKLDGLVISRFFVKQKLKVKITLNLREQARQQPRVNVSPDLDKIKPADDVDFSDQLVKDISPLVAELCVQDIKDILEKCSLTQLVEATSQFENVVCRKVDELSYTKQEFIDSFCSHPINRSQDPRTDLKDVMGTLGIKESIIKDFGDFLKKRSIPVHFILPNQALAIQLCLCDVFKDKNLLIKLGTGQGKSIAIALAALNEANKLKNNPQGIVFVFTSYDHLARRDHELGRNFFKRDNIRSICISTLDNVSAFNNQVKIIYADIENMEDIVRHIMIKLLENRATPAEKEFIAAIYGAPNEEIRIILDEYDLLLYDLEVKDPFVMPIPLRSLDEQFVKNQAVFCPWLQDYLQPQAQSQSNTSKADESSGKEYHTVPWYDVGKGFNLPVAVMRLSRLIQRAKRVIGLSGTALQGEHHSVLKPLYFEIPSSQNPEIFGTKIQESKTPPPNNQVYIACHQEKQLESPTKLKDGDSFYTINETVIQEYCESIVSDIKAVRETRQKDGVTYQRPILIFADPFFEYRSGSSNSTKKIWQTLRASISEAGIKISELTADVSDADLQKIARSGEVTLSTIKYGRGADIRVSLDIVEGLHVIVGTPVIHKRLLQQLIGRTGRMGRAGSYSAITLGALIKNQPSDMSATSDFYLALHELSKSYVYKLINAGNCSHEDCGRWLMFLTSAFSTRFWQPKIHKEHAKKLCGNDIENNADVKKYF